MTRGFRAIHGEEVEFVPVNPQTPEELDSLVANPEVVAVYLQERPLPLNQIAGAGSGDPNIKPCVRLVDGELRQVTKINVNDQPYTG